MPLCSSEDVVDGAAYDFLQSMAKEMSDDNTILQKVALAFDISIEEARAYILINPQSVFDI